MTREQAKSDELFQGRYKLLEVLGRGADSIVYAATLANKTNSSSGSNPTQTSEGNTVENSNLKPEVGVKRAIKIFHTEDKGKRVEGVISRVRRETLALLNSQHPYVIRVEDYLASPELCYLVTEYAQGGDLKKHLNSLTRFQPGNALKVITQVLSALEAIHAGGIIHRDIKPENILLSDDGTIRIIDFGIAILPTEERSIALGSAPLGTFDYLAPEFLNTCEATFSVDLYAVGVMLFELLTGQLPFHGTTINDQIQSKVTGSRQHLKDFITYDASAIEHLLEKALNPSPAGRFASATEFRLAAEQVIAGKTFLNPSVLVLGNNHSKGFSSTKAMHPKRPLVYNDEEQTITRAFGTFDPKQNSGNASKWLKRTATISAGLLATALFVYSFSGLSSASASLSFMGNEIKIQPGNLLLGIKDLFFHKELSAYERAQPLTIGTHKGMLYKLFNETEDVPIHVIGLKNNKFVFSVNTPGLSPKKIALTKDATLPELRVNMNGLRLVLNLVPGDQERTVLSGTYLELGSGREGRWEIFK
jgi:serine/threonine protein kinase